VDAANPQRFHPVLAAPIESTTGPRAGVGDEHRKSGEDAGDTVGREQQTDEPTP